MCVCVHSHIASRGTGRPVPKLPGTLQAVKCLGAIQCDPTLTLCVKSWWPMLLPDPADWSAEAWRYGVRRMRARWQQFRMSKWTSRFCSSFFSCCGLPQQHPRKSWGRGQTSYCFTATLIHRLSSYFNWNNYNWPLFTMDYFSFILLPLLYWSIWVIWTQFALAMIHYAGLGWVVVGGGLFILLFINLKTNCFNGLF